MTTIFKGSVDREGRIDTIQAASQILRLVLVGRVLLLFLLEGGRGRVVCFRVFVIVLGNRLLSGVFFV